MKKVIGLFATAALLSSCGALTRVDVSGASKDSLGLRGKPITVSLLKDSVRPQASTGNFTTTGTVFADPSDITQYINNIKDWAIQQGFDGSATVVPGATAATDCPSTLTLSAFTTSIKVSSGTSNKTFALTPSSATLVMTEGATNCQYTYNVASLLFNVTISGSDLSTLVSLLTDGKSNTVDASLQLTANELNGQNALTLKWGDTTASLGVGL